MIFSISELRKNIRKALDAVDRGEVVGISRYDRAYLIIPKDKMKLAKDHYTESSNIRPDVLKNISGLPDGKVILGSTPPGRNEFAQVVEVGKRIVPECCTLHNPCKHWIWDTSKAVYVNSITKEERDPNE